MKLIEKALVVHTDVMDEDAFLLHLQNRHPESLANSITFFVSEDVVDCYRAFHRQLHRFRIDLPHEHEDLAI